MDLAMALAAAAPTPTSWSPTTPTPTGAPPPCPTPHGWRMLRGDEVGALLGRPPAALAASRASTPRSIVSSSLLGKLAAAARPAVRRDAHRLQVDRPGARGWRSATRRRSATASTPSTCKDKDGVSALLLLCELAARAKAAGRTPARPARRHRAPSTACTPPTSSRCGSSDLSLIAAAMARLRDDAADLARRPRGRAPSTTSALGSADLPPTDGLRYRLADGRPGHRPPERHRAEAQVLPRGRRPGAARRRRRRRPDRRRRPARRPPRRHQDGRRHLGVSTRSLGGRAGRSASDARVADPGEVATTRHRVDDHAAEAPVTTTARRSRGHADSCRTGCADRRCACRRRAPSAQVTDPVADVVAVADRRSCAVPRDLRDAIGCRMTECPTSPGET